MKTYMSNGEDIQRKWWVVDANNQTLGRLATEVATLLRGKHKPQYTPFKDTGDFVVIVNAEKIHLSGNKLLQKKYYRHSGYLGGMKETTAEVLREENPERMIELAVKGMLPTNKLSRQLLTKLKVFRGPEHNHDAQKPEAYSLDK